MTAGESTSYQSTVDGGSMRSTRAARPAPPAAAARGGGGRIRYQARSGGDDRGGVDVVPVDGGRRIDAQHPGVQPGPQVQPDTVRVTSQEPGRDLVELLGPQRGVEHEVRVDVQLTVVVVERAD